MGFCFNFCIGVAMWTLSVSAYNVPTYDSTTSIYPRTTNYTYPTTFSTPTSAYPYSDPPRTTTFADRVNFLLNSVDLFPHPVEDEASQSVEEDNETELGLPQLISKMKEFLQDEKNLNTIYSNFLKQYGEDRTLPTFDINGNFINRHHILKQNLIHVAEHNLLARQGKVSYENSINRFSDMTQQELMDTYSGVISNPNQYTKNISNMVIPEHDLPDEAPGVEFNWATLGFVSPVKDQAHCGSCVPFASVAAVESAFLMEYRHEVDLSEQELLDCMKGKGAYGCEGNYPDVAFQYMEDYGLSREEDNLYTAHDTNQCSSSEHQHIAHIKNWAGVMLEGDEALLKRFVRHVSPVAVVMTVLGDFFGYHSGIYDSHHCPHYFNHMVLIVGYGISENGIEYWIAKNSWGQEWGLKGYFRIRRNHNNLCGIASYVFYVQLS